MTRDFSSKITLTFDYHYLRLILTAKQSIRDFIRYYRIMPVFYFVNHCSFSGSNAKFYVACCGVMLLYISNMADWGVATIVCSCITHTNSQALKRRSFCCSEGKWYTLSCFRLRLTRKVSWPPQSISHLRKQHLCCSC